MLIRFLFLLIIIFHHNFSYSQTCCSGGIPVSNNIGMSILEKGMFQVGLSYDYNNLNTLKEGNIELDDNSRKRITQSVLLNLGYNITENWTVEALLTWVNQKREISSPFGVNLSETKGIGDWIVLSRYRFVNNDKIEVSSGLGLKLPIGKHDLKNSQGIVLNADIQPGGNALDYIFMSTISRKFNFRRSFIFSSRFVYRIAGENNEYQKINKYKFGNEFQFFLTVSDQFLLLKQVFSANLSVKYRNAKNDLINNNKIPNTGGNWLFLIPKISYNITPNILVNSGVEIPLSANVTGLQLSPSYRFNLGIVFRLNNNKLIKL